MTATIEEQIKWIDIVLGLGPTGGANSAAMLKAIRQTLVAAQTRLLPTCELDVLAEVANIYGISAEKTATDDLNEIAIAAITTYGDQRATKARNDALAEAGTTALSAERLKMIDAIVNGGTAMEKWQRNTGVRNIDDLKRWAETQLREVLKLRSHRERANANQLPDDELEDYLIGKQAVLEPLLANMRQINEER